jgi:hypothetical protein
MSRGTRVLTEIGGPGGFVVRADVSVGRCHLGTAVGYLLPILLVASIASVVPQNAALASTEVQGTILDDQTGRPIPARVHIQSAEGRWHLVDSVGGNAVHYERNRQNIPQSPEVHTTLSPHPFVAHLAPGEYHFRVERGKEYLPSQKTVQVSDQPVQLTFRLKRWINMSQRGWYSGDTHVHRKIEELPNVMLAEDLNVALPLTYWVTQSHVTPGQGDKSIHGAKVEELITVDPTHVIYPLNTEYEIFSVGSRRHTLGAVFALNHQRAFPMGVPPVAPLARMARAEGALLDLDKHSWPWSLMIVPVMEVDLFELANNHLWQTRFGFSQWTIDTVPDYMNIQRDNKGGITEWGWIDFGFKTYYALLNCGFRMRVSAGTASGVHPVQLGFGRVYVHLPEGFGYERWIRGLDAGNSFVSTGPMLEATFNGSDPGRTFSSDTTEGFQLRVQSTASSRRPLSRIEIIVNGEVLRRLEPDNRPASAGGYESTTDEVIKGKESFWVAVRCFENHPSGRVRFAHTNPVFVDLAGEAVRPRKEEVEYFIRRMEEEIERNREILATEELAEYRQALAVYQELARRARASD